MFTYEHAIVDNFQVLREVKDIVCHSAYDLLLCIWGSDNWKDYNEIAHSCPEQDAGTDTVVHDFAKALFETRTLKSLLVSDDLFGIYIGLIPARRVDDPDLPTYFIFRCHNNGRSVIVSEQELPSL